MIQLMSNSALQRAVAILCLAVVLVAAIAPAGPTALPLAILVILVLFVGLLPLTYQPRFDERGHPQPVANATPAFSPRPPPAL